MPDKNGICGKEEEMTALTPEMNRLFVQRTNRHVGLVRSNLLSMIGFHGLTALELEKRAVAHDASKFSDKERDGYAWLTWIYHARKNNIEFEPCDKVLKIIQNAMAAHRAVNHHHPEAHARVEEMQTIDIVEMICDWHAISQENECDVVTTRKWTKENISRWHFLNTQVDLIYETIDRLEQNIS